MTARPILFSGPMIRALLEGRKTQTRRVIKFKPWHQIEERDDGKPWPWMYDDDNSADCWVPCPYGRPDDLLWVRETFIGACGYDDHPPSKFGNKPIWYSADGEPDKTRWGHLSDRRRPAIHMPRWASRLTLRITDVRVQRLRDISEHDAMAEGVARTCVDDGWRHYCNDPGQEAAGLTPFSTAGGSFASLWRSINGPSSWAINPWVWALTFDVIKANVDQVQP